MPQLTRTRRPCPRSVDTSAHLRQVGPIGIDRCHPVEAVAAQVQQASAALQIGLECDEHWPRTVFGMRAGHYDAVATEQIDALRVQIVISQCIPCVAAPVQEVGDVQVCAESLGRVGVPPNEVRSQVRDRPTHRDQADARAVRVPVVYRRPGLRMSLQPAVRLGGFGVGDGRHHPGPCGDQPLVRVGEVCESRQQKRDLGGGGAVRGCDDERHVVDEFSGPDPEGIDTG